MSEDKSFDKEELPVVMPDHPLRLVGVGAECAKCGFRYLAHKNHIIRCPLCALSARGDTEVIEALRELVACKDLRERIDKLDDPMNWKDPPGLDDLKYEYLRRKPLAWQRAREIMSRYVEEKK